MMLNIQFTLLASALLASALPPQERDINGVIPPHLPPGSFPRPPTEGDPRTNYCSCGKKDGHIADRTTEKVCPQIGGVYYDAAGDFSNRHFPGCYGSFITWDYVATWNAACQGAGAIEGVCCLGAPPPEGGPEGSYECSPSIFDGGSKMMSKRDDLLFMSRSLVE